MDNFKNKFKRLLKEDEFNADSGSVDTEFKKSLDKGTDAAEFDTEGISSLVDALCVELQADADKLGKVIKYLVDPKNPNCMLKRLEHVHKSIEFEKLFQPIEKAIEKTAENLAIAITKINTAVVSAPAKRDKRKQEDLTKQASTTSPY